MVKTPWLKIDDVFFEARGYTWALVHTLKALEVDFADVLANKNALVSLKQIIRDVCAERECHIIELETMPDRVHLLVECDPQYGIHRLVKQVKGRSSRLLREEFPSLKRRLPTLWTNSYFVATVGGAPLEIVKQYVENQRNK